MNLGLHLMQNPTGTFSFVGSVPLALHKQRVPTIDDIRGQRIINGIAYVKKAYQTVSEALTEAKRIGATLCNSPGCACRSIF